MKKVPYDIIRNRKSYIATLVQSNVNTPKALALCGISEDSYKGDYEMFTLVQEMRFHIITSPACS